MRGASRLPLGQRGGGTRKAAADEGGKICAGRVRLPLGQRGGGTRPAASAARRPRPTGRAGLARGRTGQAAQTDTIAVSSTGTVSVANHTAAPLDVVMTVMGYYTGDTDTSPGDTYYDASWIKIVDTTSGLGAPEAQVPAGGSITVQVGGEGNVAAGADTAVVQLSAINATQNDYLTAYPAGTTDPGISLLLYDGVMTYRDLAYVGLSSSGQMTITNHGTQSVDVEVVTRGYFMPPSNTPVGAEYAPIGATGPAIVFGSATRWRH